MWFKTNALLEGHLRLAPGCLLLGISICAILLPNQPYQHLLIMSRFTIPHGAAFMGNSVNKGHGQKACDILPKW